MRLGMTALAPASNCRGASAGVGEERSRRRGPPPCEASAAVEGDEGSAEREIDGSGAAGGWHGARG